MSPIRTRLTVKSKALNSTAPPSPAPPTLSPIPELLIMVAADLMTCLPDWQDTEQPAPTPFNEICPKFNGKGFTTKPPSNGEIAKWKVHCDKRALGGGSREEGCHGGSITQILNQRQGSRNFRGFTWRHNNRYTDITPHPNHYWGRLQTRPLANWAYIERINIDFS